MRPWLGVGRTLEQLNKAADKRGLRTESNQPVRFVPPAGIDRHYEVSVHETGRVATRPESLHDWFNALAWLAFPRTKARINAMHAAEIPREQEKCGGRRGRLRDLLTIFDEGGALVACDDAGLIALLRGFRWKELFWEQRSRVRASMRCLVLGHAVLEQALAPRPGITCKVVLVDPRTDADAQGADWLASLPAGATPRDLAPLPVFGYPGWLPENSRADFYDDTGVFRPPG